MAHLHYKHTPATINITKAFATAILRAVFSVVIGWEERPCPAFECCDWLGGEATPRLSVLWLAESIVRAPHLSVP